MTVDLKHPTRHLTATQRSLIEQLTENTGRHFLDSGGAYGRNWERNAGRNFLAEKPTTLDARWGLDVTHSVFHWLADRLEYLPEVDVLFEGWSESELGATETGTRWGTETVTRADLPWLQNAEEFATLIGGRGIYGEGEHFTVNTYNNEDNLSQTIQYVYLTLEQPVHLAKVNEGEDGYDLEVFEPLEAGDECPDCSTELVAEGDEVVCPRAQGRDPECQWDQLTADLTIDADNYVLLQIHGGCDVRGGYTRARFYRNTTDEGTGILDNARFSLWCTGDRAPQQETLDGSPVFYDHRWFSDDGANLYESDSCSDAAAFKDIVEVDDETPLPEQADGRVYWVAETGTLHCPHCLSTLEAGAD